MVIPLDLREAIDPNSGEDATGDNDFSLLPLLMLGAGELARF